MLCGVFYTLLFIDCMKAEQKTKSKKVITKKLSSKSGVVENEKREQTESNVSVFTRSTNPKVVVWAEKVSNEKSCCNRQCSWRIIKFVFMVVMSILLIITFFVSLRTYHIVENLPVNCVNSLS